MSTDLTTEELSSENARLRAEVARLEERLRRQERRTRLILESALEGFHIVGIDGRILDCNESFARMVGYSRSELLEMTIGEIDRRSAAEIQTILDEITAFGSRQFLAPHTHKDGHVIDVKVSSHLVDADGERFFSAFSHAITEQLERERALRESERKFRAIFDKTSMFISLVTTEGLLLQCNQTMLGFLGADEASLRGRTLWAQPFWGSSRDELEACAARALSGSPAFCEVEVRGARGRVATLELQIKPILNEVGQSILLIAEGYDVTELRRAEADRAALQQQMIHAQEAIIRELSTPLIPLDEGILVAPLVGKLDGVRAGQLLERLLQGVVAQRATTVILDVTGVPVVDADVADALVRAARAVKLLGAQAILTGVGPDVAQTLVGLGVDLRQIRTLGSLQSGLKHALRRAGARI